jgi:WD40 repeat protein
VSDATFSPDGRWIVTAGPTTAALLDAEDGTLVFLLYGHEDQLRGAIFGPTGRRIYTAGLDGSVRAYRCDICGGLPELEAIARERMRRF